MVKYPEMNDEQREEMWEEIAHEFAKPERLRKKNVEIYEEYGIPCSTFSWNIAKTDFKKRIVEISLNEAKTWIPELLEVLKEKSIVDKSEKSIEMALKYIADVSEKLDLTSKGKELRGLTQEQKANLNKILYDQKGSDRQDDNRNSTGESLSGEQGV